MIVNGNEIIEIDQWTTGNMFEILDSDLPEHFTVEYEHSNIDCSELTIERLGKTFGNVSVISVPNLLFTVPGTITVSYENDSFTITVVEAEEPETIPCACDVDVHGAMLGYIVTEGFKRLISTIYPVGAIYISTSPTSPQTLFGGVWERIEDTFLLAAGDNHSAGETGGAESQTISEESHRHSIRGTSHYEVAYHTTEGSNNLVWNTDSAGAWEKTIDTMPPYLTVYVWKRTE